MQNVPEHVKQGLETAEQNNGNQQGLPTASSDMVGGSSGSSSAAELALDVQEALARMLEHKQMKGFGI